MEVTGEAAGADRHSLRRTTLYETIPYKTVGTTPELGGYHAGYDIRYCIEEVEVVLTLDADYGLFEERVR